MGRNMANRYERILFFALAVFPFLSVGCADVKVGSEDVDRVLEGTVLHKDGRKPMANLEVSLFRLRKPLFSMQGWEQVSMTSTDKDGRFAFTVSERGPYLVRWNPEGHDISHEFPVDEFEGRKSIEILHVDREQPVYPWDT